MSDAALHDIDLTGKQYLSPGEVAHVARNVFETGIGPMALEFQVMRAGFRRLFGDDDESGIPVQLRQKGILIELLDNQSANMAEQRNWKAQQDAKDEAAELDRNDIKQRLEVLEITAALDAKSKQKTRKLIVWFVRWMTRKDDGFSVAVGKLIVTITFISGGAVGCYHGLKWIGHMILKAIEYLFHH